MNAQTEFILEPLQVAAILILTPSGDRIIAK